MYPAKSEPYVLSHPFRIKVGTETLVKINQWIHRNPTNNDQPTTIIAITTVRVATLTTPRRRLSSQDHVLGVVLAALYAVVLVRLACAYLVLCVLHYASDPRTSHYDK